MTSNKIYHRCGLAFEDGTVSLMKATFGCRYLTANPPWKDPWKDLLFLRVVFF